MITSVVVVVVVHDHDHVVIQVAQQMRCRVDGFSSHFSVFESTLVRVSECA